MNPLSYYATQSPITDPGAYRGLFSTLPQTAAELCRVVQGLCLHYADGAKYGIHIPKERLPEINTRYVQALLGKILALDGRPLIKARTLEKRVIGSCCDFASLFCAMARFQGIPARKRVGFAAYFASCGPGFYGTHDIAEYWEPTTACWRQIDPYLDEVAIRDNAITFDVYDIPRDQFLVAGRAWQCCRKGHKDPNMFGIGNLRGLGFIRSNMILDLAALNKRELLNWDTFGWMQRPLEQFRDDEWEVLDRLAGLLEAGDEAFDEMQALYNQEDGLGVPQVITCYSPVSQPYEEELVW